MVSGGHGSYPRKTGQGIPASRGRGAHPSSGDAPFHLGYSLGPGVATLLGAWWGPDWHSGPFRAAGTSHTSAGADRRSGAGSPAVRAPLGPLGSVGTTARQPRGDPSACGPATDIPSLLPRCPTGSSPAPTRGIDIGACCDGPSLQHRRLRTLHSSGMVIPSGGDGARPPPDRSYQQCVEFYGTAGLGDVARPPPACSRRTRPVSQVGRGQILSETVEELVSSRQDALWHLHDSLLFPFLSLSAVVLYRIVGLSVALFRDELCQGCFRRVLVFLLRVSAAGLWICTCVHTQFHLVGSLAFGCELAAFLLRCSHSHVVGLLFSHFGHGLQPPSLWAHDFGKRVYRRLSCQGTGSRCSPSFHAKVRSPRVHRRCRAPSRWKVGLLLYLCCADASALHLASVLGGHLLTSIPSSVQGVQLIAHGFHEGRPVFSTGTIPPAHSESDLCEVVPLGRSCNLLLPPSSRPRRQVAVFLGRLAGEPPLVPCPITMLVDERMHGPALHHRVLLNLGVEEPHPRVTQLQSPLPGLPAEQLVFLPADLDWNTALLPIDLRPLGGGICLVRGARSDTCGQLLASALELQGRFRALHGVLGRCCLGWFSLGSQPLILPSVDSLQFAYGPEPGNVQPLFGTSLEPPFTLDTLMQVSATPVGPPLELFSGFSANHAVLFTPSGLVYVEVPVFTDSNTYRRLVSLQASPSAAGGIMRLWQPLPSLPHVQFLEVHCSGGAVPCILDFRPTGWRIVTTCVEPPVTPVRALETAVDDGLDLPSEWPLTCAAGGFGILHKETAVAATQPLVGGAPFVLLFFPHIFTHDDASSGQAIGGQDAWDKTTRTDHALPPLLPGQVGSAGHLTTPLVPDLGPPSTQIQTVSPYDILADASFDEDTGGPAAAPGGSSASGVRLGGLVGCAVALARLHSPLGCLLCLGHLSHAMMTQSEPPSPRFVIEAPRPALDAARLAPPSAHQRLQTHWQHSSLDLEGPLWPVPSSGSVALRFHFRLWGPDDSHAFEFLGVQPAREVRNEILRVAGLAGRPRVFAASHGLTTTQVHLVMASPAQASATVLFDAGFEVWCADVPRHASAAHLLSTMCDLASTDALQLNTEISLPLRHGDVLPVRLDADWMRVDLSRHVLARPVESAAVWLDPVQSFFLLTFSRGVQGFQLAVSSDVQASLLRSLLPGEEGTGGTFIELPSRASLPARIFVHCRQGHDHVVFRVSEASDPVDTGFFFLFSGSFDTYSDFARRLGQLQTAEARWLRALRSYGLQVTTWESMALTRRSGSSFWYVHLQADIIRAQVNFAQVHATPASFHQVPQRAADQRLMPRTEKATQTIAGPGGFPHEIAVWQTPPQPTHCEPGVFPEISSILADVWCDAWHIKCLIPCIPEYKAWVLRDGNRLIGLCTADITWDLVSQALHISTWELPQTFVHGEGLLIPYPEPLHQAKDRCLSVSHDTPEAVHCLHEISQRKRQSVQPTRSSAARRPLYALRWVAGVCAWRLGLCLSLGCLFVLPGALGVMLDQVIADAEADPAPAPMLFRDYIDLTRTCTMSWTHELSRQTLGFSIRAQILGEHIQRIAPAPEVLLNLWRPGRGPILIQVRPRRLALHLASFLRALGYAEGIHSLHIAYDTSPHVLDLVLVPPTGGTWWILQDSTGRELLRPVTRHYTSAVHFRLLTVSPAREAQTICPAYGVQQQPLLPQGARGRVIRDLPELHGSLCQGILSFVAAAGIRNRLAIFSLAVLAFGALGVDAVGPATSSTLSVAPAEAPAPPGPHTLRIWTVGVRKPVDLPWKPEGYNTRWLHDCICTTHGIQGAGQFLSTSGAAGDSVMHLLFVPRLHGPPANQPCFWLFHIEDRASVVYGHRPFDWAIASTHLQEIYQGLNVPTSRPTLVIGSQLVAPSCHLTDVPSGSIVQIPIGALPMESSNDSWDPTPWVVPGPFFQYVPARGPAGEAAVSPVQIALPDTGLSTPVYCDAACQTDELLLVDTTSLSAQVVGDLALQLQGMADCLLSLPFASVRDLPPVPQPESTSQPAAPVFRGPAPVSPSNREDSEAEPHAQDDAAEQVADAPGILASSSGRSFGHPTSLLYFLGLLIPPRSMVLEFHLVLLIQLSALRGVSGSYFTPEASGSEDEDAHPAEVPEGHRPGDGPHVRPAGPPPPTPAGAADEPDPADARLVYNDTVPPDLNYLPGSMRTVHVARRFPAPMVIRWVQNRLIRHQHGLLPATAFLNGPIPQGTPFRFHNPFTARAQCHEVGYQEPEHIPPLGVLQAHADNRGWRGVVLLNPQPDSAAVHVIALPQHGHLVSVALLVNNRIVPCCVPRRARWRDLRGVQGRLDLPQHIDMVQDTVTFRSGDCFRIDASQDHTPASEYARLEEVDHEVAEGTSHQQSAEASCGGRSRSVLLGLLGGALVALQRPAGWCMLLGLAVSHAMHRPGSFPWPEPAHTRAFHLSDPAASVRVLYYSPFLGTFPAYDAAPGTDHSTVWAQFLNDDAAWATDFFPVWPGLHFNALAFVPIGGDLSTVTVILHYRGFGRAALTPRTVTDAWLHTFAAQQVSADIDDVFLPHGLEAWRFYDVPPPDYRLRHGDVIYLRDRSQGQDPLEAEEPWDIQTSGTGQHAPWAVGFRLDSDTVVDLLQPNQRPVFVSVPAGETWAPVQCTFSGDFHLQHPGRCPVDLLQRPAADAHPWCCCECQHCCGHHSRPSCSNGPKVCWSSFSGGVHWTLPRIRDTRGRASHLP